MRDKLRIGLYLMNFKGYSVINAIINNKLHHIVDFVVASKDINTQNDYYNQIEEICILNKIPFYTKIDDDPTKVDLKFSIGWRWMINDFKNLIVLHDSILPKYRGFAPLVTSLVNGEKKIGVTALFASEEYDRGNIIKQKEIEVTYPIKIFDAINDISNLYIELVIEIFNDLNNGITLTGKKQKETEASYSVWLDESDYFVDWNDSANKIKRKVDACGYPYLGARFFFEDKVIIIKECEEIDDICVENRTPGKIFSLKDGHPHVLCGQGLLKLTDLEETNGNKFFIKKLKKKLK